VQPVHKSIYGDGGAVFTDDDETADLLRSVSVHGKGTMKYDNVRIGLNSRLDTLQAAVLSVKLKAFREYELDDVNKAAEKYTALLGDIVKTPVIPQGFYSSWAQYTIQLGSKEERDGLQARLKESGIPAMIYYPKPMHKQQAFEGQRFVDDDYRNTIQLCNTVLALPLHPYLTDTESEKVTGEIRNYLKEKR
jgi:Predicted pyridoxal phosphate-dependent enzyme apparently involved in regulation of cell wall biogenesis